MDGTRLRILFIGNSYVYVNNLPELLVQLSAHEAKPVEAEMVVEAGATLGKLWEDGKALAAMQRGQWDYVVLQEQSTLGGYEVVDGIAQIGDPSNFYEYTRKFDDAIRATGAKTLLYLTWARQNAPQSQALLTNIFMTIAQERHALVAPVGIAWMKALAEKPDLPFYLEDGSHPQPVGSYLAACVFYAAIYGKSPEGLTGQISVTWVDHLGDTQQSDVNLTLDEARFLQRVAWQVVSQQPSGA